MYRTTYHDTPRHGDRDRITGPCELCGQDVTDSDAERMAATYGEVIHTACLTRERVDYDRDVMLAQTVASA